MAYIRTTDQLYPVYEDQIRTEYSNTSFPVPFVPPEEYELVFPVPPPPFNPLTQVATEAKPVQNQGGWEQAWTITNLSQEDAARNMAEAAIQEAKAEFEQDVKTDALLVLLKASSTVPDIEALVDKTNHRDLLKSLSLAVGLMLRQRYP